MNSTELNSTDKTAHRLALLLSVYVLGGVTACGEVTFKRGAGPDAMQASEQSCRAKTSDVDAYAGCLRAAGYTYAKPSETDALFVDEKDEPAADESAAALADTAGTETIPHQPPADVAALNHAAPTVSVEPSDRAGQSQPTSAKAKTKLIADPLAEVSVASWWKLGGTARGLESDQGLCAGTLGHAHRVAPNAKVVTIGMLRCLKDNGWFAVGR